jgi:hypothetical protein
MCLCRSWGTRGKRHYRWRTWYPPLMPSPKRPGFCVCVYNIYMYMNTCTYIFMCYPPLMPSPKRPGFSPSPSSATLPLTITPSLSPIPIFSFPQILEGHSLTLSPCVLSEIIFLQGLSLTLFCLYRMCSLCLYRMCSLCLERHSLTLSPCFFILKTLPHCLALYYFQTRMRGRENEKEGEGGGKRERSRARARERVCERD